MVARARLLGMLQEQESGLVQLDASYELYRKRSVSVAQAPRANGERPALRPSSAPLWGRATTPQETSSTCKRCARPGSAPLAGRVRPPSNVRGYPLKVWSAGLPPDTPGHRLMCPPKPAVSILDTTPVSPAVSRYKATTVLGYIDKATCHRTREKIFSQLPPDKGMEDTSPRRLPPPQQASPLRPKASRIKYDAGPRDELSKVRNELRMLADSEEEAEPEGGEQEEVEEDDDGFSVMQHMELMRGGSSIAEAARQWNTAQRISQVLSPRGVGLLELHRRAGMLQGLYNQWTLHMQSQSAEAIEPDDINSMSDNTPPMTPASLTSRSPSGSSQYWGLSDDGWDRRVVIRWKMLLGRVQTFFGCSPEEVELYKERWLAWYCQTFGATDEIEVGCDVMMFKSFMLRATGSEVEGESPTKGTETSSVAPPSPLGELIPGAFDRFVTSIAADMMDVNEAHEDVRRKDALGQVFDEWERGGGSPTMPLHIFLDWTKATTHRMRSTGEILRRFPGGRANKLGSVDLELFPDEKKRLMSKGVAKAGFVQLIAARTKPLSTVDFDQVHNTLLLSLHDIMNSLALGKADVSPVFTPSLADITYALKVPTQYVVFHGVDAFAVHSAIEDMTQSSDIQLISYYVNHKNSTETVLRQADVARKQGMWLYVVVSPSYDGGYSFLEALGAQAGVSQERSSRFFKCIVCVRGYALEVVPRCLLYRSVAVDMDEMRALVYSGETTPKRRHLSAVVNHADGRLNRQPVLGRGNMVFPYRL